jgi:dTDP-4-amino-4,6-dideoxy-D-galactose acyltransferase
MVIEKLQWDTDFFGYEVARAIGFTGTAVEILEINQFPAKLMYVFAENAIQHLPNNFFLADEKVVFKQKLQTHSDAPLVQTEIKELFEPNEALVALALQSGLYSRFNVDANFKNHEFERLYTKWIENSFDTSKNARVFGYVSEEKLLGFVTLGFKNNIPDIGLIAVDEQARGQGIGSKLLQYLYALLIHEQQQELTVTTQGKNLPAMAFYQKNFFEVFSTTYIYHVWK